MLFRQRFRLCHIQNRSFYQTVSKSDLKVLQQKKFSNVVLQISKIKIIKNEDAMDALVNKISKEIAGRAGIKLKPIEVEVNV